MLLSTLLTIECERGNRLEICSGQKGAWTELGLVSRGVQYQVLLRIFDDFVNDRKQKLIFNAVLKVCSVNAGSKYVGKSNKNDSLL